jgi:hypothetical protein
VNENSWEGKICPVSLFAHLHLVGELEDLELLAALGKQLLPLLGRVHCRCCGRGRGHAARSKKI